MSIANVILYLKAVFLHRSWEWLGFLFNYFFPSFDVLYSRTFQGSRRRRFDLCCKVKRFVEEGEAILINVLLCSTSTQAFILSLCRIFLVSLPVVVNSMRLWLLLYLLIQQFLSGWRFASSIIICNVSYLPTPVLLIRWMCYLVCYLFTATLIDLHIR